MSERTFHPFMRLPTEIRFMIWDLCLPVRVVERTPPWGLLDGSQGRECCSPTSTTIENTKLPVIAAVCRESRFLALSEGQWLNDHGRDLSMKKVWAQPRRDTIILNFDSTFWTGHSTEHYKSPLDTLLTPLNYERAIQARASVMATDIYPFHLNPLPWEDNVTGHYLSGWYSHYHIRPDGNTLEAPNTNILKLAEYSKMQSQTDYPRESLDVIMAAVPIHVDKQTAVRSGLFGLLGDAPIQMVDADDLSRLSLFEDFWDEHIWSQDPSVEWAFKLFKRPQFQQRLGFWKKRAEWTILAHMWCFDHVDNLSERWADPETGPGSAWRPYLQLDQINSLNMVRYSPNDDNPWVIGANQIMPKLHLKIMVRLCTHRCNLKDKREVKQEYRQIMGDHLRYFAKGTMDWTTWGDV